MRMRVRNERRRVLGRAEVNPAERPTRVLVESAAGDDQETHDLFLNWEGALDDAGQVRRCVACGCSDLFQERAFPQVTALVIVLAFAGAAVGALGFATTTPMLLLLCAVLAIDVAILLFSKRRLVCYRCRSTFMDMPIARYHRGWDRALADRYPTDANDSEGASRKRVQPRTAAQEGVA